MNSLYNPPYQISTTVLMQIITVTTQESYTSSLLSQLSTKQHRQNFKKWSKVDAGF